ncbi:MAG: carboxypeptidase regulatory-like domain-containing protein [Pseudomonadota bacterium]|uniref:hypothetical protein n=1 Tax=Sinimarinibacterium flocculans TaxID=985250 RepID=UPI002493B7C4|nr:hypothetical protein [Sinimarinibacterium flocculans]MEC9365312.1 carboxypeptidase regulatory-like domain-containing protein [Pseudomonadota bacterium]
MNRIHRTRAAHTALSAALAGVFSFAAAGALAATDAPPEQRAGSIEYRVGGIGAAEAETMRRLSSEYPLTLTFVERAPDGRNMYTAGVGVTITDSSGNAQLETKAQGPLLMAELPDGRYTVSATLGGDTKTREVKVSNGQPERVVFVWPQQSPDPRQLSRLDP